MLALGPSRRPLAGFALSAILVYATTLAIVSSPLLAAAPRALSAAITIDLLVTVPLLYWFLAVRRARVPAVTLLPVFLVSLAAARLILPEGYEGWLGLASLTVLPLVEVAVMGVAAVRTRRMVRRMRATPREADPFDAFRDALEEMMGSPALAHAVAAEVMLVWYALLSWRSAPRVAPDETAFTNDRRTGAMGVMSGLGMATTLEGAVVHVLVAHHDDRLAWVLTALSAYTLLWIVGFARALRLRPVTLGPRAARVRVGMIWDVAVPSSAIAAVDASPRAGIDRETPGYLHAAFVGTPQTVVTLREPVDAIGLYGWRKRGIERIGVYVDDPVAFRAELTRRAGLAPAAAHPQAPEDDPGSLAAARRAWADRHRRTE
ncbi:hypothetical protein [Longimicrobium sp.]|uniref:hypothetical protein n=1 Tax=Longimicrobium sp. TaxID=2029185 RepID=UPI002E33C528|nr:hypothetical protein [Longimicrobium sp.]HEX6042163.1 hypothetical protein [Longimicrobium sp.]